MIMDWTGYPIAIDPDVPLVSLVELSLFLGGETDSLKFDLLRLIDRADVTNRDVLAGAYPRESVAYGTWQAMPSPPTGAELLDALAVIPDPAPDQPGGELVQVQLDRLMAVGLPSTGQAMVTLKHRIDDASPWRTGQYTVPTPAIEVDAALLNDTSNARLSVRLTVQETE
jgi:hypothetical protein